MQHSTVHLSDHIQDVLYKSSHFTLKWETQDPNDTGTTLHMSLPVPKNQRQNDQTGERLVTL